jgi:hypothetical protein
MKTADSNPEKPPPLAGVVDCVVDVAPAFAFAASAEQSLVRLVGVHEAAAERPTQSLSVPDAVAGMH